MEWRVVGSALASLPHEVHLRMHLVLKDADVPGPFRVTGLGRGAILFDFRTWSADR
jgi:hypothetical protein